MNDTPVKGLLTEEQRHKLLVNYRALEVQFFDDNDEFVEEWPLADSEFTAERLCYEVNIKPVARVVDSVNGDQWLLAASNPENPDRVFGLIMRNEAAEPPRYASYHDYFSLSELESRGATCDVTFVAQHTMGNYIKNARIDDTFDRDYSEDIWATMRSEREDAPIYRVYYAKSPMQIPSSVEQLQETHAPVWPLRVASLDNVFEEMNQREEWTQAAQSVFRRKTQEAGITERSMSIGDVVENVWTGSFHVCGFLGWHELPKGLSVTEESLSPPERPSKQATQGDNEDALVARILAQFAAPEPTELEQQPTHDKGLKR